MSRAPLSVLLVDDDPGDVVLISEVFAEHHGDATELSVVNDGAEALALLRGEAPYGERSRPDVVLLDLNLPGKHGLEVLAEIKDDSSLRTIPVIVLSTSDASEDVLRSYYLHANAYITKPTDFGRFREIVQEVDRFFGLVAKLPPQALPHALG
jgi:CheY-like chemotaxis protein